MQRFETIAVFEKCVYIIVPHTISDGILLQCVDDVKDPLTVAITV